MGLFAVLFVGTGGSGIWILTKYSEPNWAPLELDSDFSATYTGAYGESYGEFLVGVSFDNNKDANNLAWWSWTYKNKFLADKEETSTYKPKSPFSGTSIDNDEKLRLECQKAFKAQISKIKTTADNIGSDEWYKEDIWRYCSNYSPSPKTIEEAKDTSYGTDKFGETNKSKLASTKSKDNDWFWGIRAVNFFKNASDPVNSSNVKFQGVYKSSKNNKDEWVEKFKEACENAYKESTSTINGYKDDIFKFCSFKGSE